jgi:hypothetical protein
MQFLAGAAAYIDARSLAGVDLLVVVVCRTLMARTRRGAVIVFAFAIALAFAREAARVQTPLRQCALRARAR